MAYKRQIIEISEKLNAVDINTFLFHQNRLSILLKRVKTIVDLVKNISESTHDLVKNQSMMLLLISVEEIFDYVVLFSTSDKQLAAHIVKYGSDEEQFIKWNERLQHCVAELKLEINEFDVFDEASDFHAFQKDLAHLKGEILNVAVIFHGKNNEHLIKSLQGLVQHQSKVRSTYQTKTAPDAPLEMNPKKFKFERIIGCGGKSCLHV